MKTRFHTLAAGITRLYLFEGEQGPVLLDAGIYVTREHFLELFSSAKVDPSELKLIIISHAHPDHYSGVEVLKGLTSAPILAHKMALDTFLTGKIVGVSPRNECGKRFIASINPRKLPAHFAFVPDILIDSEFDLLPYGINGRLIPTPGHSKCNLSLLLDSGEAFVNDMVTTSPFTGEMDFAILVDDEAELFQSLKMLLTTTHTFYAAHGGPYSRVSVLKLLKEKYSLNWG